MISFEFSNGHPYGPQVPTSIDDDDYVEYQLDNLADFPSNAEEEERMFMEAVMESLKDLKTTNPVVEQQPRSTNADPQEPSRNEKPDESLTVDRCESLRTESNTTATTTSSSSTGHNLASQLPSSPDTSASSIEPSTVTAPSLVESAGASASHSNASSVGVGSSSSVEMAADTTKATVTVVKNNPGSIRDGLMRRWDLNFFRNSR